MGTPIIYREEHEFQERYLILHLYLNLIPAHLSAIVQNLKAPAPRRPCHFAQKNIYNIPKNLPFAY